MIKKRKKNKIIMLLYVVTSVLMISFMGVGYAAWTDEIKVIASISTAKVDPIFSDKHYSFSDVKGENNLKVTFFSDDKLINVAKGTDNHVMLIEGKLNMINSDSSSNKAKINNTDDTKGYAYEGVLNYSIQNNSTVPIKFNGNSGIINGKVNGKDIDIPIKVKNINNKNSEELEAEISLYNGDLKLILTQQKGILNVGESFYDKGRSSKLHIDAMKEGKYSFEIELPFVLWNNNSKNNTSWSKKLIIKGKDIEVIKPTK